MNPNAVKNYPVPDFKALQARIAALGGPPIDLALPSGTVTVKGCRIQWAVSAASVTVTVISKPFYVSYGEIWNDLGSLFANAPANQP